MIGCNTKYYTWNKAGINYYFTLYLFTISQNYFHFVIVSSPNNCRRIGVSSIFGCKHFYIITICCSGTIYFIRNCIYHRGPFQRWFAIIIVTSQYTHTRCYIRSKVQRVIIFSLYFFTGANPENISSRFFHCQFTCSSCCSCNLCPVFTVCRFVNYISNTRCFSCSPRHNHIIIFLFHNNICWQVRSDFICYCNLTTYIAAPCIYILVFSVLCCSQSYRCCPNIHIIFICWTIIWIICSTRFS